MKKYISILVTGIFLLAGFQSKAQVNDGTKTPIVFDVVAGDSLATADTVFKRITLEKGYGQFSVQLDIKKGTGTLDGKLYLLTSVNGGRFVLTDSASITAVPSNALTTNSGYTHTAIIQKASPGGYKYIAYVTQAGSLTASPTLWSYLNRKRD
jgi:hypothetical protein